MSTSYETVAPSTDDIRADDSVPAGFIRRWAAVVIDGLVVGLPLVVLWVLTGFALDVFSAPEDDPKWLAFMALYYLGYFLAAALYFASMESSSMQATLGKRVLGIKVTDLEGRRLGFGHALGRWFAAALSYLTLYIGFLMAAFTRRKQALHDFVAQTQVVDRWAYTDFPERQKHGLSGCLVAFLIAMLCVPVLAILAAISISQYQDYATRAQVQEAMSLADEAKVAIGEYVNRTGGFPDDNAEAGLPAPEDMAGSYVRRIDVGQTPGRIVATFSSAEPQAANASLDGTSLVFVATLGENRMDWSCSSDDLPQKWCPTRCDCQ